MEVQFLKLKRAQQKWAWSINQTSRKFLAMLKLWKLIDQERACSKISYYQIKSKPRIGIYWRKYKSNSQMHSSRKKLEEREISHTTLDQIQKQLPLGSSWKAIDTPWIIWGRNLKNQMEFSQTVSKLVFKHSCLSIHRRWQILWTKVIRQLLHRESSPRIKVRRRKMFS